MSRMAVVLWVLFGALLDGNLARAQEKPAPSESQAVAGVVNINTASPEELMYLPGIGPSKAQSILAKRTAARFVRPSQMLTIRGIGPKTFLKLKPYIIVEGPTTLRSRIRLRR